MKVVENFFTRMCEPSLSVLGVDRLCNPSEGGMELPDDWFTYGLKTFLGLTVIAASIVVIGTHFPTGLIAIAGFFLGVVVSAIIEGVNIEL